MALNPAFASASINPSQSMGNDVSAPAQGALPTSMPQNTGFSGLGQQPTGEYSYRPDSTNWRPIGPDINYNDKFNYGNEISATNPNAIQGSLGNPLNAQQINFMGQPQQKQPQYTMPFNQPSTFDISQNAYLNSINQQANIGGSYPTYEDWSNSQMNRLGGGQSTQGTDPFAASIGQQPQGATMPKRPTSADALQAAKAGNHVLAKQLLRQAVGLPADEEPIPSVGQPSLTPLQPPSGSLAPPESEYSPPTSDDGKWFYSSGQWRPNEQISLSLTEPNNAPTENTNFGLPQTSKPIYTDTPDKIYTDLKKQYAGIDPFAASIGQQPQGMMPFNPTDNSNIGIPTFSPYRPGVIDDPSILMGGERTLPPEQIQQRTTEQNNKAIANPNFGGALKNILGGNFNSTPTQPTDYAKNDASLPQNIQEFLKKDRAGSVMDAGGGWSYDPTTQKFNSYTMGGSQTKSLDEMQDYVNNQGKPPAIVQGALGNANTAQQPQGNMPLMRNNFFNEDTSNITGKLSDLAPQQPQRIPARSFFEGPDAGRVPMGFNMVDGEMVRIPNAQKQFTSPPQISSPLTQGTDTQLPMPEQQLMPTQRNPLTPTATPTGTTPMATNPLSQVPVAKTAAYTPAPIVGTASSGGGSFTQGAPLPNITTTQQQVTAAPEFYTDYLNQLAKQGASTAQNAQYVGATDLQNQAFDRTSQNVGNYQSALQNAINLAQNVGSSNLSEAIGNLGQANIARNLAPQATAGIVGSGQFGSKRGAAALGDTIANAQLGITAQQAQALQQDMQNRLAASQQLGNLASSTQQLGLGDINALATMGGQKQTIAQNEQLFPMQQLTNQSQLLRGYTIPTSTGSSYTGPIPGAYAASPLQQIAGLGALGAGISQTKLGDAIGRGLSGSSDAALTALSKLFNISGTGTSTNETNLPPIRTPDGRAATPNGDGSYTTSDGQIVGVDGNPIGGGGGGTDRDFDFIDDDNVYPGFPE